MTQKKIKSKQKRIWKNAFRKDGMTDKEWQQWCRDRKEWFDELWEDLKTQNLPEFK